MMETVYIYVGISVGAVYYALCVAQMKGFIERDGCTIKTFINCILTPFTLWIAPLVFGGECIHKCVKRRIYGRENEESQNNQPRFEGFQETTNNSDTC